MGKSVAKKGTHMLSDAVLLQLTLVRLVLVRHCKCYFSKPTHTLCIGHTLIELQPVICIGNEGEQLLQVLRLSLFLSLLFSLTHIHTELLYLLSCLSRKHHF